MNDFEKRNAADLAYSHTIDLVVFSYSQQRRSIEVLLIEHSTATHQKCWALPGSLIGGEPATQSLEQHIENLIKSELVGFPLGYFEQVGTVGDFDRVPGCWSSSTFYFGVVSDRHPLRHNQQFFPVELALSRSYTMLFDHKKLIDVAYGRLISKSLYTSLPLLFLGHEFTEPAATAVYTAVLGRKVLKSTVIQRLKKLLDDDFISKTDSKTSVSLRKAAVLYRTQKDVNDIFYFERSLT